MLKVAAWLPARIYNYQISCLYMYSVYSLMVLLIPFKLSLEGAGSSAHSPGTAGQFVELFVCLNKRLDCGLQHCETTEIRSVVVK
jgi:hypothetical protein